jgi:hypothetical protein
VNKNLPNAPELQQLRRAALALAANPFTARRAELDLELTSGRRGDAAFGAALLEIEALASRCLTLEGRERLSSADRESAFRAYLFALFHRSIPAMTQLIAAEATSEAPVPAPFAQAIVAELESKSVPRERAERLVALLYQTQRAFVFLSRELRGPSSSMQRLRASLWNAVFTHDVARYEASLWDRMEDFSALLLGETGTGKGAAAAARSGARASRASIGGGRCSCLGQASASSRRTWRRCPRRSSSRRSLDTRRAPSPGRPRRPKASSRVPPSTARSSWTSSATCRCTCR